MLAALSAFVFGYPVVMAVAWIIGGLYYYLRREHGEPGVEDPPPLETYPGVSILVPCHNEGSNVHDTIAALVEQRYPEFEIVAVDDGSSDDTGALLDELASSEPRLRVVHLAENQGKAVALRTAAIAARYEYLVCVDGDALLDEYATHWMVSHLVSGTRVGAVTGNPRIRNRVTLLGRLQAGEFSSIIGLIKRAQRTYGRVFTVSGVICAFRRTALLRVGWWSDSILTEDIDISWRLQMDSWDVRYEPRALCSILMPETLGGLWKQRLRWAQGGAQVVRRHAPSLLSWRRRRMWPVLLEALSSAVWAFSLVGLSVVAVVGALVSGESPVDLVATSWHGVALATVCLVQFGVSILIDRRYEPDIGRTYVWMIWYPIAFWLMGLLTVVAATPSVLLGRAEGRAVWAPADRGRQHEPVTVAVEAGA